MEDLARSEYPAMLANLQPSQAVQTLNERVKRMGKINAEIADWLQERRRVEDQYVQNMRKLILHKVPNSQSELGVFQGPWEKILKSLEGSARSHQTFSERLERDVEIPLRQFSSRKEVHNISTISANLTAMARDLEDAQDKADKLSKKGSKANSQKLGAANSLLDQATQTWESQSPFIFETLQELDEMRINQLRDVLTQWQTHETDMAQRRSEATGLALAALLEVDTKDEIQSYAARVVQGKPKLEKKKTGHSGTATNTLAPPSIASSVVHDDDTSDHSGQNETKSESRLRRLGTMIGRRRQSIHGGFGQISPQKSSGPFTRNLGSSHGRGLSPRASSNNLSEANRLSSLAETPDAPEEPPKDKLAHEGANGVASDSADLAPARSSSAGANGAKDVDVSEVPPPPGPPPSHANEASKDSEGFTIPGPANDPISEAQREAGGEDAEQPFKLNIQSKPVEDEDPDAKQAAMTNVASTLSQMALPSRKMGTTRGRRDVRNTIYVPASSMPETSESAAFPPPMPTSLSRPSALASEGSLAGSDSQSVRSANSLGSLAHMRHPEMTGPGLNSSIVEMVSVSFEEGQAKAVNVIGEIAFAYGSGGDSATTGHEMIRINNFPNLSSIGPNRIFVQNSSDHPDRFSLDVSQIPRTTTAFSYRVFADDLTSSPTLTKSAPLILRPAWKPSGGSLGVLVQYHLNPECSFSRPVTLHNVVFVASYQGGRAIKAQTKPTGTHLGDKHLVYWRMGELTLVEEPHKIVCRIVGADGIELQPGHVEVRWEHAPPAPVEGVGRSVAGDISISRLVDAKGKGKAKEVEDDPFSDDNPTSPAFQDGIWEDVPLTRKIVSGKYDAKA